MESLKSKPGEVTAGTYLLSFTEIVNSVQQTGTGDLLIVTNYVLGLIWESDSIFYLFDFCIKDKKGNLSSPGTVVLLKFDSTYSLEDYM